MAVIKIKNITNNLQKVTDYAKNGDKTDNGILVSAINCNKDFAYEEMSLTKKFFHKEGKRLGYHIIQSFKGNELSPKKANLIGKQLAEELWGDKYQVVICTHINKENIHNHIILNSVSFIDGKKYHNSNAEIAFLKELSDRLCYKNGLDVLNTIHAEKEREFRQKHIDYFNRRSDKMQKVIFDIDEAIKPAKKYSGFKFALISKGYEIINDSGKYLTIKTPFFNRNVRIDRVFGEKYSVQGIKERIYGYRKEKIDLPFANLKTKYYRKIYTGPKINKFLLNTSSFYRLYVHYLYAFKILPTKVQVQEFTPEYYKEKRKNNMMFEEINFLARHKFESLTDVKEFKEKLDNKLPELKGIRENLWRRYKKVISTANEETIKSDINKIKNEIDTLYGQINVCKKISEIYRFIYNNSNENKTKLKNNKLLKKAPDKNYK